MLCSSNCRIEIAGQQQSRSGIVAVTQKHPKTTHESLIENGTMMGGGWEVDGNCSYVIAFSR